MASQPDHLSIGRLGEAIACKFLLSKGFTIKGRNYRKKWGELDIVAEYAGRIRFIEVKSVSRWHNGSDVHRPEDNIHLNKVKRLRRIIQSYLLAHKLVGDWQFDVVTVRIDNRDKKASIVFIENVIL